MDVDQHVAAMRLLSVSTLSPWKRSQRRGGPWSVRRATIVALAAASLVGMCLASAGAAAPASGPARNGLVAFVRCCGPAGIEAIRPDGSGEHRIYRALADDAPLTPSWSPDGRLLVFVPGASRPGVWVMRA